MTLKRMPFGRLPEYLATLTDQQKQRASVKHGRALGDDSTVKLWKNRLAMARAIRKDEKHAPCSQWSPVVPLGLTEGY